MDSRNKVNMGECKALFEACTPELYRRNIFRITGLPVEATIREAKRRIEDLIVSEGLEENTNENAHYFALRPAPSAEVIREAGRRLQDPERRVIDEFFWFWPMKWGEGDADEAVRALQEGNNKKAFHTWLKHVDSPEPESLVAKHNRVVFSHLIALDYEIKALECVPSLSDTVAAFGKWETCLSLWNELIQSEAFWSVFAGRIRMLNDPQLTTGFARRIRANLPEAFAQINFKLALTFAERGNIARAEKHVDLILDSSEDLEAIPRALAKITEPLRIRIMNAVEEAKAELRQDPLQPTNCANKLHKSIKQPLRIIGAVAPHEGGFPESVDVHDSVAEAFVECAKHCQYAQSAHDILVLARRYVASTDLRASIDMDYQVTNSILKLEIVSERCEAQIRATKAVPGQGISNALNIYYEMPALLVGITDTQTLLLAKDIIAGAMNYCAVTYGNNTHQWAGCPSVLADAYSIATDPILKTRILENQRVAIGNIQSEPSVSVGSARAKYAGHVLVASIFIFILVLLWVSCETQAVR